jgi:hypothetical protein
MTQGDGEAMAQGDGEAMAQGDGEAMVDDVRRIPFAFRLLLNSLVKHFARQKKQRSHAWRRHRRIPSQHPNTFSIP